jgi:multimeric flavodoxin WrbA
MSNVANRKRVLGIIGSPRRGGNTETLADENEKLMKGKYENE